MSNENKKMGLKDKFIITYDEGWEHGAEAQKKKDLIQASVSTAVGLFGLGAAIISSLRNKKK